MSYGERWSALHGGYDPSTSKLVGGWLRLAESLAGPLARRDVSPNALTAGGVGLASLALPAAALGRRWNLVASAAVTASGLADGLDGAVAVLSDRATPLGFLLDSLSDRVADVVYLAALRRAGAPRWVTLAAAGGIFTLEYSRARAGNAGFGEIGAVTVGERPTRIIVTAVGLAIAGLKPDRARLSAGITSTAIAGLAWVGAGQFLRVAGRALRAGA